MANPKTMDELNSDIIAEIHESLGDFLRKRRSNFEERPNWGDCLNNIDCFFESMEAKAIINEQA